MGKQKNKEPKKVNLTRIFVYLLTFLSLGIVFILIGSHYVGVSWDEIDQQRQIDAGQDQQKEDESEDGEVWDGHMGTDELLILNPLPNEISTEEFNEKKESGKSFVAYFYSPYCPFCESSWENTLNTLEDTGVDYVVVNVNKDVPFLTEEHITSVPSLAIYEEGEQNATLIGEQEDYIYVDFVKDLMNEED